MSEYGVKALSPDTWDARRWQNDTTVSWGLVGTYFHTFHSEKTFDSTTTALLSNDWSTKTEPRCAGFDGDKAVAWAEYAPEELPNIYHRRSTRPISTGCPTTAHCLFVDKNYRRKGLTAVALQGALDLIRSRRGVVRLPADTRAQRCPCSTTAPGTLNGPASPTSDPRARGTA